MIVKIALIARDTAYKVMGVAPLIFVPSATTGGRDWQEGYRAVVADHRRLVRMKQDDQLLDQQPNFSKSLVVKPKQVTVRLQSALDILERQAKDFKPVTEASFMDLACRVFDRILNYNNPTLSLSWNVL